MQNKEVSHSRYTMFRCMLAIAHADGIMNDAEIGYFEGFMNRVPFTDEQRDQLEEDMVKAQDVFDLFREINDPEYRSQVLYFCRIMAYKDGVLHPTEKELLEKLHIETASGLDMDQINEQVRLAVNKEMLLRDIALAEEKQAYLEKPDNKLLAKLHVPWFWYTDKLFLSMGIDLLDQ